MSNGIKPLNAVILGGVGVVSTIIAIVFGQVVKHCVTTLTK